MSPLLVLAAAISVASAGSAMLLLRSLGVQERQAARLVALQRGAGVEQPPRVRSTLPLRIVLAIGSSLARSGLLSAGTLADMEQTLQSAGFRGANGLGLFVGAKLLLLVGLPALAWFALHTLGMSGLPRNAGTAVGAVIGLLLPDYWVRSARARFLKRLDGGLPDALDMMVICSEAGLGLEAAITRVAGEIGHAHTEVATELQQTASELRIMSDRRVALQNMGTRTGLENLKRLGATLVQTMQYGTPLSQALRQLSAEMRGEALTRFEARAARLPVLLTVPMIVFILPTVFMVVGGPAMLKVMSLLSH